jgi:hypothetical protein
MSKFDVFMVIATIVGSNLAFFLTGIHLGEHDRQATIVKECKETGMYVDRGLFIFCQAGKPKVVPKPETL